MNVERMKELKIMKAIMKTMKRNIMMIVMAVALALPAVAVDYGYKSQYAVMPPASFQSTSTMAGSGSAYTSNPILGNDGTATYENSSGPNRRGAKKDGPDIEIVVPPIVYIPDPEALVPIGDAALPLLLLACAYLCGRVFLKRKRALKG